MRGISFVALLYVAALCCLLAASIDLYTTFQFWREGESAVVESSDSMIQRYVKNGMSGPALLSVVYRTPTQRIAVPQKPLGEKDIRKLAAGQPVRIRFLASNPLRAEDEADRTPVPWAWLLGGLGLLALAAYAHRLLRMQPASRSHAA